MNRNPWVGLVFLLVLAAPAAAGDPGESVPDIFDPAAGRRPAVGEWLEYLVAYPADPLENRLGPHPLPPPAGKKPPPKTRVVGPGLIIDEPVFEPGGAWRALPLRLIVREREENGYRVTMTFAGTARDLFLPATRPEKPAEFRYEPPQPEPGNARHRVGDNDFEVRVTERRGRRSGFIRYFHPDLPFGIARFATADLDLILVATGTGEPPPFPAALAEAPNPAPGALYGAD